MNSVKSIITRPRDGWAEFSILSYLCMRLTVLIMRL